MKTIDHYEIIREIKFIDKQGPQKQYSQFLLVKNVYTQEFVLLKKINQKIKGNRKLELMGKEIQMLKKYAHPNIAEIINHEELGIMIDTDQREEENEQLFKVIDEDVKYIAMKYGQYGHLSDWILAKAEVGLPVPVTRHFYKQIVSLVSHLHSKGIALRDLSLRNFLITQDFEVKLVDLKEATLESEAKGKFGDLGYIAPEAIRPAKYNPRKADMFSLGVILFHLHYGKYPFHQATKQDIYYKHLAKGDSESFFKVHSKEREDMGQGEKEMEKEIENLLSLLLIQDVDKRATIKQVKEHSWLNGPQTTREELEEFVHKINVPEGEAANDEAEDKNEENKDKDVPKLKGWLGVQEEELKEAQKSFEQYISENKTEFDLFTTEPPMHIFNQLLTYALSNSVEFNVDKEKFDLNLKMVSLGERVEVEVSLMSVDNNKKYCVKLIPKGEPDAAFRKIFNGLKTFLEGAIEEQ